MKILITAHAFYPEYGGLEQQIYLLAQEYIKLGYEVDVLTEKSSLNALSFEQMDSINVIRMPYYGKRSFFIYFSLFINISYFILRHRSTYDLIIIRAALTYYPLIFGIFKKFRILKSPTWVTADTGGDADEIIIIKQWPFYKILLAFFKSHSFLNSICSDNYHHYKELGFDEKKLTRIPNGVDVSQFNNSNYPKKVRNFLFLAKIIKKKGIYELLNAFLLLSKEFNDVKLFIGGDGPELDSCKEFILKNNLESNVYLLSKIGREDINNFYNRGECLVLPSYSEGFSLTIAEAIVRKKVIVSTDVSDLKQNLKNMTFLCNKKDAKSLFNAMKSVYLKNNFDNLDYEEMIKKINIKNVAEKIVSLLNATK